LADLFLMKYTELEVNTSYRREEHDPPLSFPTFRVFISLEFFLVSARRQTSDDDTITAFGVLFFGFFSMI